MLTTAVRRKAVALAAAYALALQGLLAAFGPAAAGPSPFEVLCAVAAQVDDGTSEPGRTASHDCQACALPGCAGGAPVPQAAAALDRPLSTAAPAGWTPPAAVATQGPQRVHGPRGPPRA